MRTAHRHSIVLAGIAGLVFALPAHAQPRKKAKPATQTDIERLEKRIDDQQKVIDKLVRLQKEYLQAINAIFEGGTGPSAGATATVDKPLGVDTTKAVVPPARPPVADPQPVRTAPRPKKVEATGVGTIVGKVAGASDAIVYVEDIVAPVKGSAAMKQEGKQFVPQVLVVTKGTKVEFPNRDAIFHNVFSVTPEHSFDLGSYRQGESKSVTMGKPGVVTVYCNMHPQMVGHILITPNSNYVRAGKDGFFRLTNVPAGNHRIVAWAPNAKPSVVQATVTADEVVSVELAVKKGRAGMHTKKDGLPYGSYEK